MNESEIIKHIQSVQVKLVEDEKKLAEKIGKGEINDDDDDDDDILKKEVLKSLKLLNNVEINKNILKVTKVGITVNKLTKINNREIKKLSESIVQKWKEIAMRENQPLTESGSLEKKRKSYNLEHQNISSSDHNEGRKKKHTDKLPLKKQSIHSDHSADNTLVVDSKTADKNGIISGKSMKSEVIDVEKINDPQKAMDWNYEGALDNDVHRDKAKQFLFKAFITGASNSLLYVIKKERVNELIWNIENELYKFYVNNKKSQREYNMQLKSIKFNLGDKKNPDFNEKIYKNVITPQALAVMNSQDMASEEKKSEREKCLKESLIACQSDWDVKNILLKKNRKGEFQCFKCKGYETIYNQLQTRSSDEPMTTFVTCLKCRNRWKF